MSLDVIITTSSGMLVAGDRRVGSYIHPIRVDDHKFRAYPTGMIFFDDCQKIISLDNPHTFVAFAYTGDGAIDCHRLARDTGNRLTHRLSIQGYAEEAVETFRSEPSRYAFGNEEDAAEGHQSNFVVVGYNENSPHGTGYKLSLPSPCKIERFIDGPGYGVLGTGDHLESGLDRARNKLRSHLENAVRGDQLLGRISSASLLTKLAVLRNGSIPFHLLSKTEASNSPTL